ncbi:MAG: response regulator [Lachnospira sp.]
MFCQLFGKYLVEENIISAEELSSIFEKMKSTRAKLGVIAVACGFITEEQAEEINKLQTKRDARFGDIAVSEGYITKEQLDEVLGKQGNAYIKFVQILSESCDIPISEIDSCIEQFKKDNGFTDDDIEAFKQDDIDSIVSIFAFSSKPYITEVAGLVLRNITRFVSDNYYIGKIEHVQSAEYKSLSGQKCVGDIDITIALMTKDNPQGFIDVANGYAGSDLKTVGDECYDAVGEFINCVSGLFSTATSKKGINVEIQPQFSYENQVAKGESYILPIFINNCELDLLISVDSNLVPGNMPLTRKMQANAGSDCNADSKGNVLIIDDSGMSRKMLRNILEEAGYTIIGEATDGLEGELAYKQYQPDLVTLDITMPNLDGVECLKRIMDYDPAAKVIMITAAGQQNKVIQSLKLGAKKFVTKPYDKNDVVKNINEIMEQD